MKTLEARFTRTFNAGDVVFREGDAGKTMFVVRSGRVRITQPIRGGERVSAVLGPGEFFGELSVLSERPRQHSAHAVDALSVLELDERRFELMITTQADIAARILKKLALRLADAQDDIAILAKRDPKSRVILGMIREAELRGVPGQTADSVLIKPDPNEFSAQLGVQKAELEEMVARMVRVGIVRAVSGGLELLSIARLNEFLGFLEQRGIVQG